MSEGISNNVYVYANYELVEQSEEFEYKNFYFAVLGRGVSSYFSVKLKRRSVTTMTWEATLQDGDIQEASEAYKHEQGYPGYVNPGNLDEQQGWRLLSVEYTKSLTVPMSKVVRETWYKTGQWEDADDYVIVNETSVLQGG